MVSIIAAPPTAPQIYTPPPVPSTQPRLDQLDQRLVEIIRDEGSAQIWFLLNKIGDEEAPGDRATARAVRLSLWDRLKRLLWLRVLWRLGRKVVGISPPPARPAAARQTRRPRVARPRNRRAPVKVSGGHTTVSTPACEAGVSERLEAKQVGNELVARRSSMFRPPAVVPETQTVSAQEISSAARALARLPRGRKRWTGWLHGQHCWRGQLVVTSGGEVVPLIWSSRGRVLLQNVYDLSVNDWFIWGARREHEVTLFKHPAAVALGQMKRGVRERKSEAKARAARLNGLLGGRPKRATGAASKLTRCV